MSDRPNSTLFRAHPHGVIVEVQVVPNASRTQVVGQHGNRLRVRVTAAPEQGKANQAVARLISDTFGTRVDLLSGATSRVKRFLLRDVTRTEAEGRIHRNSD